MWSSLARPFKTALAVVGVLTVALNCNSRAQSGAMATPSAEPPAPTASTAIPPLSPDSRTEDERNTIAVFRAVARSTVFVTERQLVIDYFRGQAEEVPAGAGSGFIWDMAGHVITNFHVVKDARSLVVTLQDHKSYEATIVGVEPRKDIAVLQIKAPNQELTPIRVADKIPRLEVGQKAIAIGNPFGLDQTLTTGVISAIGREVQGIGGVSIRDMVQTDAAINPGNSGGPLLDSSGRLIGMNTMIYSRSGTSAGIGFAVPVTSIARVVPQIIKTGHAEQVGLGIQIDPAQRLEQRANIEGVVVLRVVAGSPAEKAGIRGIEQDLSGITLGDVLVAIGKDRIKNYDDLYNTLDRHHAGEHVEVTLLRDGKPLKMTLELVSLP